VGGLFGDFSNKFSLKEAVKYEESFVTLQPVNKRNSLRASRLQFVVEETIDIAGTLMVEAGGIVLKTLVGVRVDDRG